jgi:hypothetical protein
MSISDPAPERDLRATCVVTNNQQQEQKAYEGKNKRTNLDAIDLLIETALVPIGMSIEQINGVFQY